MNCPHCNAANPEDAYFCGSCGGQIQERTLEHSAPDLGQYEPPPLRIIPTVRVAAKTDLGRVRENNEDKFEFYQPDQPDAIAARGSVFIVCDGVGGAAAGQIASELACKNFLDIYYRSSHNYLADAAGVAVTEANRIVVDVSRTIPDRKGMGTTFTALIVCQDKGLVIHIGDSRCYRLSGEEFGQVTRDHTWVEEQVMAGLLTREEALRSHLAHMITNAIGSYDHVTADMTSMDLREGDKFLLCSDGLTNHVDGEEIREHLHEYGPSNAAWRLVNLALERGGSDNCTVLIAEISTLTPPG